MKSNENPHKACDNCKYFAFRYYRADYKFLVALKEGRCGKRKYTEEERAELPFGFVCDKWAMKEREDVKIAEINDELRDITARLILIVKALSK